MKKYTGIWLDFSTADIINVNENEVTTKLINAEIEDFHAIGGSRSKTPWGPTEKISESKLLERRKHQISKYYAALNEQLSDSDELLIMGPAEAKIGFSKYLKSLKNQHSVMREVLSKDSMSLNQKIAIVKDYFQVG